MRTGRWASAISPAASFSFLEEGREHHRRKKAQTRAISGCDHGYGYDYVTELASLQALPTRRRLAQTVGRADGRHRIVAEDRGLLADDGRRLLRSVLVRVLVRVLVLVLVGVAGIGRLGHGHEGRTLIADRW
jgi:hypothetical protein